MPSATQSTTDVQQFYIPDTLRYWPYQRQINPYYTICKEESMAWVESSNALTPKAQASFNRCDFGLMGSLVFAQLDKDGCRLGCDLMHLGFLFDKYLDAGDEHSARIQADVLMHALRNPSFPPMKNEWAGGNLARQFSETFLELAGHACHDRFLESFKQYTDAVVQRSADKTQNRVRGIQEYFELRRDTIATKPQYCTLQIDLDLPDSIFEDIPQIEALEAVCTDMMIICNDLCSYNVEQARGDDVHNLVTIVMHELGFSLQDSMSWISDMHDRLVGLFVSSSNNLPGSGDPELDEKVRKYIDRLGNCVRAHDCWSFETEKYFGKGGLQIQETRIVDLLPRVIRAGAVV